jgi:hypothetical protein
MSCFPRVIPAKAGTQTAFPLFTGFQPGLLSAVVTFFRRNDEDGKEIVPKSIGFQLSIRLGFGFCDLHELIDSGIRHHLFHATRPKYFELFDFSFSTQPKKHSPVDG